MELIALIIISSLCNCSCTSDFVVQVPAVLFYHIELCLLTCSSIALFSNHLIMSNKWLHEKPAALQQHSPPLVCVHSRLKSQLWYVMHVLKLRSAQHLSGSACMFYGWTVRYGCSGMVQAELKKEMGLQHVSGDHNHRKQEHNCLEYTDSRKCTAGEGQEDWGRERERDGWSWDQRRRFVARASKVKMATKKGQGHFSMSFPFDT